ncbi:Ribonuclease H-like superfamily [Sesbania bispinosa]|nr:Ribonuclease H-like superfamily [Sesbania bispinosa]
MEADFQRISAQADVLLDGHWSPPPLGSYKLNADGRCSVNGDMGTGGLLRNSQGDWCMGFSSNEGHGNAHLAELLAFRNGIELAWSFNLNHLICESDALEVVNLILGSADLSFHPHTMVVLQMRSLLNCD